MRAALHADKAQYPQVKVRDVVGLGPRKPTVSCSIATRGATRIRPDLGLKGASLCARKAEWKAPVVFSIQHKRADAFWRQSFQV